jgi:hypothetical protein
MKGTKLVLLPLLIALLFAWGCERKVTNEIIYQNNGLAGSEACMECHGDSDLKLAAAQAQWERSTHAEAATAVLNANADEGACERCHTAEGFLAYITGEPFDSSHYSSIGCFTCHAPHTTGNLSVRVTSPVTLGNGVLFDQGAANVCATCHQSRRNVTTYVADSVRITNRFGPHHSNQSDMLAGTGGYEYTGFSYENSAHSNVAPDGCVDCHMSPSIGLALGGHTFKIAGDVEGEETDNVVGCNAATCHDGAVSDFTYEGVQEEIVALVDTLGGLLYDAGLVDSTFTPQTVIVKSKDTTGAVYNFMFVKEDRSEGLHNTDYTVGLLTSSINFMRFHSPNGPTAVAPTKMASSH